MREGEGGGGGREKMEVEEGERKRVRKRGEGWNNTRHLILGIKCAVVVGLYSTMFCYVHFISGGVQTAGI